MPERLAIIIAIVSINKLVYDKFHSLQTKENETVIRLKYSGYFCARIIQSAYL